MPIHIEQLNRNPDDTTFKWHEDDHQAYTAQQLRQQGYCFQIGLEGIRLSAGLRNKAKALGMESGFTDLCVYLPKGKTVHIELKRWGGVTSGDQKDRHKQLAALGHVVYTVKERTPYQAWMRIVTILDIEDN